MKGLGVDLIELARIDAAVAKSGFLERIYTPLERSLGLSYQGSRQREYWAGRWAAKEAVAKALGSGFGQNLSWQEIEISKGEKGEPLVALLGKAHSLAEQQGISRVFVSITHTKELALAIAVACGGN